MVFTHKDNGVVICKCSECHQVMKSGIQCAYFIYNGTLRFDREFCSWKCLNSYVAGPRIFEHKLVEHFYNECVEEAPTGCEYSMKEYLAFIEKHKSKFLGPVSIDKKVQDESNSMTAACKFLLGHYHH